MIQNKEIKIFGTGRQTRDFIFIDDIIKANIKALNTKKSGIFNLSTQKETPILSLYEQIRKITGYCKKKIFRPQRPGDIFKSCLSNKKARQILKWSPKINLKTGLIKTYQYFLS
jgi:UDP-glucose 4-epimerase